MKIPDLEGIKSVDSKKSKIGQGKMYTVTLVNGATITCEGIRIVLKLPNEKFSKPYYTFKRAYDEGMKYKN